MAKWERQCMSTRIRGRAEMGLVYCIARDAALVFRQLGMKAERILEPTPAERRVVLQSGIPIIPEQYAAYLLATGFVFALAYSVIYMALALIFGLDLLYLVIALLLFPVGIALARFHFRFLVNKRARDIDMNLLDALRHMLSELEAGANLADAICTVARGDYGAVSELLKEAYVRMREGENVETAFRELGERTPSTTFAEVVAALAYYAGTGGNIESVLEKRIRELELSQRTAVAIYTNEAMKLSTFVVVLTGVLPGLLIFVLAEGGFVFGFRLPPEVFLLLYIIGFPAAKYVMQARLMSISPGV